MTHPSSPPSRLARGFSTTQWSIIQAAAGPTPDATKALSSLCETYWQPIYSHVRQLGNPPDTAFDLTQAFFEEFITRNGFAKADPVRGRFRSFLCRSIENFLHHQHRAASARKRGGGLSLLSRDSASSEGAYIAEPLDHMSPALAYERRCARVLIDGAFACLRRELVSAGKAELFDALRQNVWLDPDSPPYSRLADQLGVNPTTLRVTVMRLRARFATLLREEISRTVADPADIEDELRHLISSFSTPEITPNS